MVTNVSVQLTGHIFKNQAEGGTGSLSRNVRDQQLINAA